MYGGDSTQVNALTEKPEVKEIPAEYEESFYYYDDVNILNEPCKTRKVDYQSFAALCGTTGLNSANQQIEFEANDSAGFLRIAESYLLCNFTFKIKTTANPDPSITAPATDFFWKLFSTARLDIGPQTIETINNVSKVSSMIGKCLHSKAFKDTGGIAYGWAPDNGTTQAAAVAADVTNHGFVTRRMFYNLGGDAPANGLPGTNQTIAKLKPLFGFCDWDKVMYGMTLKLSLTRSAAGTGTGIDGAGMEEILFGSDTANKTYYFSIESLQWVIPSYQPKDLAMSALLHRYTINADIPVRFLKRFSTNKLITGITDIFPLGTASSAVNSSFNIPKFILVGFKPRLATCATCHDGFPFKKVKSLVVKFSGEAYPRDVVNYSVDLTAGKARCARAYEAYTNWCWKMGNEPTMSISHFRIYDAIFCFDTSAHVLNMGITTLTVTVEVEFDELPVDTMMYVTVFSDSRWNINTAAGKMIHVTIPVIPT
jgi:hypothetical protein